MSVLFERVTIAGVGLLGASLGLALKKRGLAGEITGTGRRVSTLETALSLGAIDRIAECPEKGAREADLFVICTPAAMVIPVLDAIRPHAAPGLVATDVASTKGVICRHAADTWGKGRRFVGSHPMAGSEQSGPENGRAGLYENTVCLVETAEDADPEAVALVQALWRGVGASVVPMDPAGHDRMLAATSHLPHVAASALAWCAAEAGGRPEFVGNGFRDTTRIAASRAEIWRDICLTNREALAEMLRLYAQRLDEFSRMLSSGDAAGLDVFFEEGRAGRDRMTGR